MRSGSKSFPTRNGTCQIFTDRIEFHGEGLSGRLSNWLYQKGFKRVSILYALLFFAFLLALVISLWIVNYFLAFFFFGASLVVLYGLWTNRQVSLTPLITRRDIIEVNFQKAVEGKARASMEILFEEEGKKFKKLVSLSPVLCKMELQ